MNIYRIYYKGIYKTTVKASCEYMATVIYNKSKNWKLKVELIEARKVTGF